MIHPTADTTADTTAATMSDGTLPTLPVVRGSLRPEAGLGRMLWLRAGGGAQWLFQPQDEQDLAQFLRQCPPDVPITVLGAGSNVIIRDGGIRGVVIRLGAAFSGFSIDANDIDANDIHVEAGALAPKISVAAGRKALGGLEFLLGIPGTIGGCVRMNAGAHGREMKDVLKKITAVDRSGKRHDVTCSSADFSYRRCHFPKDWIITSAVIMTTLEDRDALAERMKKTRAYRRLNQPSGYPTGGSTFLNPGVTPSGLKPSGVTPAGLNPGVTPSGVTPSGVTPSGVTPSGVTPAGLNPLGEKAWRLIERSGCRGLRRGDAMVSQDHCNFLVNLGHARGEDFENLGEEIRRRVQDHTGITLEWEIIRIGEKKEGQSS